MDESEGWIKRERAIVVLMHAQQHGGVSAMALGAAHSMRGRAREHAICSVRGCADSGHR